jgi:hypothetical protein
MSSACSAIVPTARANGKASTRRIASVITTTASQRRPPTRDCTARIKGQVATTIIPAHTIAARNGWSTHSDARIRTPMTSTPSVMRARSREGGRAVTCIGDPRKLA